MLKLDKDTPRQLSHLSLSPSGSFLLVHSRNLLPCNYTRKERKGHKADFNAVYRLGKKTELTWKSDEDGRGIFVNNEGEPHLWTRVRVKKGGELLRTKKKKDKIELRSPSSLFVSPLGTYIAVTQFDAGDMDTPYTYTILIYEASTCTKIAELGKCEEVDNISFINETTICFSVDCEDEKEEEDSESFYSMVVRWDFSQNTVTKQKVWRCSFVCASEGFKSNKFDRTEGFIVCSIPRRTPPYYSSHVRVFRYGQEQRSFRFKAFYGNVYLGSQITTRNYLVVASRDRGPRTVRVFDLVFGGALVFVLDIPLPNKRSGFDTEMCYDLQRNDIRVLVGGRRRVRGFSASLLLYHSLAPLCAAFASILPPYVILLVFDTLEALRKRIGLQVEERWMHDKKIRFIRLFCTILAQREERGGEKRRRSKRIMERKR